MGRRRIPTEQLLLSGAVKHDPKRYADRIANEPKPELGISIPAPSYLSKLAQAHWDEFIALLSKSRVVSENDTLAMCMLCEAFAEWRDAMHIVRIDKSRIPSNYRRYTSAFNALLKIQQEFGMTPASRSKVSVVSKAPDKNKFAAMGSKRGQAYKEPE